MEQLPQMVRNRTRRAEAVKENHPMPARLAIYMRKQRRIRDHLDHIRVVLTAHQEHAFAQRRDHIPLVRTTLGRRDRYLANINRLLLTVVIVVEVELAEEPARRVVIVFIDKVKLGIRDVVVSNRREAWEQLMDLSVDHFVAGLVLRTDIFIANLNQWICKWSGMTVRSTLAAPLGCRISNRIL